MNDSPQHTYTFGGNGPDAGHRAPDAVRGREFDASGLMHRSSRAIPSQYSGLLFVLAFVFAAGLYVGVLLFGNRTYPTPEVVVCPGPGAAPVAVLPAECGSPQGVTAR